MRFTFPRTLKVVGALLSAILTVIASIALTAAPAAASVNCSSHKSGGVTFSVCVYKVNATTAKALIGSISGTHVSGNLALYKGDSQVKTGCSGQYYTGDSCSFSDPAAGSGHYYSVWHSKGGGQYSSPEIVVS
jgi:hypothetical protein